MVCAVILYIVYGLKKSKSGTAAAAISAKKSNK